MPIFRLASITPETVRPYVAVAAPVLATCVFAAAIHALVPSPMLAADAVGYDRAARGLAGDGDFGWAMSFLAARGYVYPSLVAIVYALGGDAGVAGWIQAVLVLPLTTLLIYAAGREAFSRRAGLVGAWAFALWLPAAWHTRLLLTETLVASLMAALAFLLAAMLARNRPVFAFYAGFVAGIISVTHSAYQILVVLVAVAVYVATRSVRLTTRYAAGALVVLIPYLFVVAAGAPRLGSGVRGYGGAWSFYVGSRQSTHFTNTTDDDTVANLQYDLPLLERLIERGQVNVEPHLRAAIARRLAHGETALRDGDYYRAGISNLVDEPAAWPSKLRTSFGTLFILKDDEKFGEAAESSTVWLYKFWRPLSIIILLLALLGLARVLAQSRALLLIVAPALLQMLLFMVPKVEPRYVIPLWPAMFVLVGLSLSNLPSALVRPFCAKG